MASRSRSPRRRRASPGARRTKEANMARKRAGRREFLASSATAAGMAWAATTRAEPEPAQQPSAPPRPARIRFGVIGLNHGHINGQTDLTTRGGGELVAFFAKEDD